MDDQDARFQKHERLRQRQEFLLVYSEGAQIHTPHFVLYVLENGQRAHRLGMTVSKKIGKAVIRGLIRRRLREIFRRNKQRFMPACDWVLNVKRAAAKATYEELEASFLCSAERWQREKECRPRP